MPTPRMSGAWQPREDRVGEVGRTGDITREVVTAVTGNLYKVHDVFVPGADVQAKIGDVVRVQWRDGKPIRVIEIEVRRGKAQTPGAIEALGVVEQLFVAGSTAAGGKATVWFRNHNQITELRYNDAPQTRIFADWSSAIQDVFWGVNNDIFCVREGTGTNQQFHVYRINRPGNTAANPTGGNQKVIATQKVTVKEKLYTIKPADSAEVSLIVITLQLRRDSVEPHVFTVFNFNNGTMDTFFLVNFTTPVLDTTYNINSASVDRTIRLKLKGETISITVDGAAGSLSELGITVPALNRPTATIMDAIVNENNDLVWNTKIVFSNFAMGQGNPTEGLTGQHIQRGPGLPFPFGFFNTFLSNFRTDPDYPFDQDDLGVMDFFGHGNPGGVLYSAITETHSVMFNAKQGTIITSTMPGAKTLKIEETANGNTLYNASRYVGFQDLGLHDPGVGPEHGYTYGFRPTYQAVFGPITLFNVTEQRLYGVIQSDRSLFDPALPYTPDNALRTAQALSQTQQNVGFITERTDGWDSHGGNGAGFFTSANQCVETRWIFPRVDIVDRYNITVTEVPFFSSGGSLYKFVVVLRNPAPGSGFPADPKQLGVFVVVGSTVHTILNYTTVTTTELPVFKTGNKKHVIFTFGGKGFLADYIAGTLVEWTSSPAKADTLQLLQPDFLYSYEEKKLYFVKGWDRTTGALTLIDTGDKFPPKDARVGTIGSLKPLTSATKGASKKDNHVIVDTALVPLAYRT